MNFIKSGTDSSGKKVELFYQDLGKGRPVVLIHGWPLSHEMWQYQLLELPKHGLRAIAYDRRGFGHSSKPGRLLRAKAACPPGLLRKDG